MGRCSACNPPGLTLGPVRKPEPPVSPEVVAIGHDRQIPHIDQIYAGESAVFPLVFDPVDYVSTISDFSTDTEGVTLSLEPNVDNVLRVAFDESLPVHTIVPIFFKDQLIINLTAVPNVHVVDFDGYGLPADINVWQLSEDYEYSVKFDDSEYVPSLDDFSAPEGVSLKLYVEDECILQVIPTTRTEPFAIYFLGQLIANVVVTPRVDVTVSSLNLTANGGKTHSDFGNSPEELIEKLLGARIIINAPYVRSFEDGVYEEDNGYIKFDDRLGNFIHVLLYDDPETDARCGDIVNVSSFDISIEEYINEDKIYGYFVPQS